MNKVLIGLICFFLVLALLFNFADDYDYTYTGDSYEVDFITPTQINANQIESSFQTVMKLGNSIVTVVSDAFYALFSTFREGVDMNDVDGDVVFMDYFNERIEYAKDYISTLNWWDRYIIAPTRLDGAIALVRDASYEWGYYANAYSYNYDIANYIKYFGWSERDIERIHEFCVEHERTHTYNGVLYDYR